MFGRPPNNFDYRTANYMRCQKSRWCRLTGPAHTTSSFSFFLVRRAKRARHANDHARRPCFSRLKMLASAYTPLTKSEEKETGVTRWENDSLQTFWKSAKQTEKKAEKIDSRLNQTECSEPFDFLTGTTRGISGFPMISTCIFFTYQSAFPSTKPVKPLTQRLFTDLRVEKRALSKISYGFKYFSNLPHWFCSSSLPSLPRHVSIYG